MATLRGAIRSYGAAVRRIERDQQRQARESAKRFKQQQKLQEIQNAQQAVSDYEYYVQTLQSVHKYCTEPVDWEQIKNTDKPIEPKRENKNEGLAKNKLESFKPSFIDKIFGLTQKKENKLKESLSRAIAQDQNEFDIKNQEYKDELKNWEELQKISEGIFKKDTDSYKEALQYFSPFSDLKELGSKIYFKFTPDFIDVDLHVNSLDQIPDYELKLTSTGKMSKKALPKARFNELYQDYVCSSALRLTREVFAYLPVDFVRINALAKILNSKTGHLEEQPILSVIFPPETINSLNLDTIDPSDSMQNFIHNMSFTKTKGFNVVQKVEKQTSANIA